MDRAGVLGLDEFRSRVCCFRRLRVVLGSGIATGLLLVEMPLLLVAMHLLLIVSCYQPFS